MFCLFILSPNSLCFPDNTLRFQYWLIEPRLMSSAYSSLFLWWSMFVDNRLDVWFKQDYKRIDIFTINWYLSQIVGPGIEFGTFGYQSTSVQLRQRVKGLNWSNAIHGNCQYNKLKKDKPSGNKAWMRKQQPPKQTKPKYDYIWKHKHNWPHIWSLLKLTIPKTINCCYNKHYIRLINSNIKIRVCKR